MISNKTLSWPCRTRWRAYFKFLALFYLFFFPIYLGTNYLSSHTEKVAGLYFVWERDIPLLPWMIWPYISLYWVFLLPLFHLSAAQIMALSRQSTAAILMAGAIFLLLPAHLAYMPVTVDALHQPVFELLHSLDRPHNLVPSLHVTFGALILLSCASNTTPRLAWGYRVWLLMMAASTVLVHQHHLIDVLSGLVLALALRRLVPLTPQSTQHKA